MVEAKTKPQTKEKIVTTAFILFLKRSYANVSMKDIMSETNLSKGAIYHHFKSKHEIYLATIDSYFVGLLQGSINLEDNTFSFRDKIKTRLGMIAKTMDKIEHLGTNGIEYPMNAYYRFLLEAEQDDKVQSVRNAMKLYRQEAILLVEQAKENDEFKVDLPSEVIAQQLIALIEGVIVHNSDVKVEAKQILKEKFIIVIESYLDLILKQ